MIKRFCDKCGKEVPTNETFLIEQRCITNPFSHRSNEICKDCFQEFRAWIGLTPDEIVIPDKLKKHADNGESVESEETENGRTEGI